MKICFDIDDTLWKIRRLTPLCTKECVVDEYCQIHTPKLDQVPDYDLIQVLRWFFNNGDEIFFWSAGGIDYCETIVRKLGLDEYGKVVDKGSFRPDIAFDDAETDLGIVDIRVNRIAP